MTDSCLRDSLCRHLFLEECALMFLVQSCACFCAVSMLQFVIPFHNVESAVEAITSSSVKGVRVAIVFWHATG